jgi:hypothetical protein
MALSHILDGDGVMSAPSSDVDEESASDTDESDDMQSEWQIVGQDQLGMHPTDLSQEGDNSDSTEAIPTFDGLLWEHGVEIIEEPLDMMEPTPATIPDQHKHLFATPVDAMFAVLPYTFWESMTFEVNRYAGQCLDKNPKKLIVGYKWTPVTVQEMLVFFAILILFMMYPQTGRRMRDAWSDPDRNPWMTHMSKAHILQICSTLHFNDNSDSEGTANDSLYKIRPLLNIVTKTIGRYAMHGSQVSFDEATIACYSRFARHLLSFNPMKPTGKFHFKIYMLCCTMTKLTLSFRIHAREGPDDMSGNENTEINQN